jgi:hypothetical protein
VKLVIPKSMRGTQFERLFPIEMNDFDVERLLPSLFYLVVTRGRQRGSQRNDALAVQSYMEALANHPAMKRFDTEDGRRLLNRWIRTSIIRTSRVGRAKKGEQVEFVLPLTLLCYKTGFPAEIRRQRNVHVFVYSILLRHLKQSASSGPVDVRHELARLFQEVFGGGVVIGDQPQYNGQYDGSTELDIHALLSLYYLDGLRPTPASNRIVEFGADPALPQIADKFAQDILRYMRMYHGKMPTLALTRRLTALINFQLFIYTVKLVYAVNHLVRDGEIPPVIQGRQQSSDPELYVDFTREKGNLSDSLACACVERDLEELANFSKNFMLLRTLDMFAAAIPNINKLLQGRTTPDYLEKLVALKADVDIAASARHAVEAIKRETLDHTTTDVGRREVAAWFDSFMAQTEGSDVDRAVRLLVFEQNKRALQKTVQWFWNVGGLRKSFGFLSGNLRGRRTWRYCMGDDLLAALVQLAMLQDHDGDVPSIAIRDKMPIDKFLRFLEFRFGIIVNRPPRLMDTISARDAARNNVETMKRRLRQMGFFEALSDDFTAQYIRIPMSEEYGTCTFPGF